MTASYARSAHVDANRARFAAASVAAAVAPLDELAHAPEVVAGPVPAYPGDQVVDPGVDQGVGRRGVEPLAGRPRALDALGVAADLRAVLAQDAVLLME